MAPCLARGFLKPRIANRRRTALTHVVFHALVLVRLPVGSRKTRGRSDFKVAATLAVFLGPRSPRKGARELPRDKPKDRKWATRLGEAHILQKRPNTMNNNDLKKRARGRGQKETHVGPKGTPNRR